MAQHWQAEREVDEGLAAELVRTRFPELAVGTVELVTAGWDYTVHRIDGEWAFRFPRREVVLEPMRRELAVLRQLPLDLPVPRPVHVADGGPSFPWPFWGARWLPGTEASDSTDEERRALAPQLGRFLRRLHATDLGELPVDVVDRADMRRRVPMTREELAAIADRWEAPFAVDRLLDEAERLAPLEPTATCHGDLHFRQLLAVGSRLTGVVDWVDVCRSDPGIDLMLVYAFLPPDARAAFFSGYGAVGADSLMRARVLALFLSAVLARYGRDQG
ncbi:MAG TPA: phosphotransferase, partial [Acidimicrobiales bacterium]|nr:phosphotransferase [Acidimicrobiales bacterium]